LNKDTIYTFKLLAPEFYI